jgi:putative tryptophan/tyrosine transport system substrate-binding protein
MSSSSSALGGAGRPARNVDDPDRHDCGERPGWERVGRELSAAGYEYHWLDVHSNGRVSRQRLQLLKEMVPGATRVAFLEDGNHPGTTQRVRATETAARTLGLVLKVVAVRDSEGLNQAFLQIKEERVDAVLVPLDPLFYPERRRVAELAAKHALPEMYEVREHVDAGGLASYGASFPDLFWRATAYVDKILKGAKPADLPIEQPKSIFRR